MIIIGLTGPTGSGKSSASAMAAELGFTVVDCDKLARVAVEKGTNGLKALTAAFGKEILTDEGELDRKALAQKAFASEEKTELLNKTILPFIAELVKKAAVGERVILDAPTLFESGIDSMCHTTLAVLSDTHIRLARIMERDGIDKESAMLRIRAGKTDEFYKNNAEHIIYNNGEPQAFLKKFEEILASVSGKN